MSERKSGLKSLTKKLGKLVPRRRHTMSVIDEWPMKDGKKKGGDGTFQEATGKSLKDILFPK
jgi:hypothetical protein